MLKWILDWWDSTNRSSDLTILWPICKKHAPSLDYARAAFFMHVNIDPAWNKHYSHEELIQFVDTLT